MNKTFFILGLIAKTFVQLFFIVLFIGTIGVAIFVGTYLIKTIQNSVKEYNNHFNN